MTTLLAPQSTIVFEGDSLTSMQGQPPRDASVYGWMNNWQQTYADRVAHWLFCNRPDLQTTCKIAAVGGSTCQHMLERYEECVRPLRPAWVVLTIGTNDGLIGVLLEEFQAQFTRYCETLRNDFGGRVLYVGGFLPYPHASQETTRALEQCMPYYKAALHIVTQNKGIAVDVGKPLRWRAEALEKQWAGHSVYSNGVHYNAVGNEIMATQVLAALGLIALAKQ